MFGLIQNKSGGTTEAGLKRHTPITFGDSGVANKHSRTEVRNRELYTPPSGKYSNKVSSYGKLKYLYYSNFDFYIEYRYLK